MSKGPQHLIRPGNTLYSKDDRKEELQEEGMPNKLPFELCGTRRGC